MGLSMRHVRVAINGKVILPDISLDIEDGEFFSLLGSSGCGKSTLLKAISGLIEVQEGEIELDGVDLLCLPPRKRGTVIVFQDQRLFTNMTVGENVTFSLRNRGVRKAERAEIAERYLEMVQLGGFADRRPHQLSGGQSQRVALARALAAEPKLLLLDEPFSALDENLRNDMRILVRKLHDDMGVLTIMVTHDQREALSMSDRMAIMEEGRILQTSTPAELYENPASPDIAMFFSGGDIVEGAVRDGVFRSAGLEFATSRPDGRYRVVVRDTAVIADPAGSSCKVASLQYQGESLLATLDFDGVMLHHAFGTDEQVAEGDVVAMLIDSGQALFFPCED